MSTTAALLAQAHARGPHGACPLCGADLAGHRWAPWFGGASERRGVWFECAAQAAETTMEEPR